MPPVVTIAPTVVKRAKPIQPTRQGRPTSTKEQRTAAAERRKTCDRIVQDAFDEFWEYTNQKAEDLADKCGNKKEYYLCLMFSGGVDKMKERRPNAYNAWAHQLMNDKENGE